MRRDTLKIENANIFWTNFAGEEKMNNPEGRRNFCVSLDPETADILANENWNVKVRQRNENEDPTYHIQVDVRFDAKHPQFDPEIYLIDRKMKRLSEEQVGILDNANIISVDLEITPYDWGSKKNGTPAIKAYLKTMYVTIETNPFAEKYAQYLNDDNPF